MKEKNQDRRIVIRKEERKRITRGRKGEEKEEGRLRVGRKKTKRDGKM